MNTETLKLLTDKFLLAQHTAMMTSMCKYTKPGLDLIKNSSKQNRKIATAFMVLEKTLGLNASFGFASTLSLLDRCAKLNGDPDWCKQQFELVGEMDETAFTEYFATFIEQPETEINKLLDYISVHTALNGYLLYWNMRYPNFREGAYLIIGILMQAESYSGNAISLTA